VASKSRVSRGVKSKAGLKRKAQADPSSLRSRENSRNPVGPAPSSILPFDESAPGAVRPSRTAIVVLAIGVGGMLVFAGLAIWSVLAN
jgi:hypothetical protein